MFVKRFKDRLLQLLVVGVKVKHIADDVRQTLTRKFLQQNKQTISTIEQRNNYAFDGIAKITFHS